MHDALKWETLAPLAELPHGYLLAESDPRTYAYLEPLLRAETGGGRADARSFTSMPTSRSDLGRGRTPRSAQVFAAHVNRVAAIVAAGGARPMIWDDAIQADPSILGLISKRTVIVDVPLRRRTVVRDTTSRPSTGPASINSSRRARTTGTRSTPTSTPRTPTKRAFWPTPKPRTARTCSGMFETVWHDDGESLYEATWAPVAFAAATAWQVAPVDRATWHRTFAQAFFGADGAGFAADLDDLAAIRDGLRTPPESDPPNYLFWADPFEPRIQARMQTLDLAGLRVRAERVLEASRGRARRRSTHRRCASCGWPRCATMRSRAVTRSAKKRADYYDDARTHLAAHDDGTVERSLNVAKYLCWEMRDEMTALEPLYAAAWSYESRPAGLARVLVRYRAAAAARSRKRIASTRRRVRTTCAAVRCRRSTTRSARRDERDRDRPRLLAVGRADGGAHAAGAAGGAADGARDGRVRRAARRTRSRASSCTVRCNWRRSMRP